MSGSSRISIVGDTLIGVSSLSSSSSPASGRILSGAVILDARDLDVVVVGGVLTASPW